MSSFSGRTVPCTDEDYMGMLLASMADLTDSLENPARAEPVDPGYNSAVHATLDEADPKAGHQSAHVQLQQQFTKKIIVMSEFSASTQLMSREDLHQMFPIMWLYKANEVILSY